MDINPDLFLYNELTHNVWTLSFHKGPFQLRQHLMSKVLPCEFSTVTQLTERKRVLLECIIVHTFLIVMIYKEINRG